MWVKRVRSALKKQKTPFVIVQSWNKDIVLLPTILLSFVFALVESFITYQDNPTLYTALGGIWFTVFLLNWIILRFDLKIMWVAVLAFGGIAIILGLQLLGWLESILEAVQGWKFYLNAGVYLGLGIVFSIGIFIAWLHQQFSFALITPNEAEIHSGLFGTVEKISREQTVFEKNVSDDALEKGLFQMGTIIIRAEVPTNPRTFVYTNVLFVDQKESKARDIQNESRVIVATANPTPGSGTPAPPKT